MSETAVRAWELLKHMELPTPEDLRIKNSLG